jgi:hypothetical protein
MDRGELSKRIDRAHCRVFGWQDATSDGHRAALVVAGRGTARVVVAVRSGFRRTVSCVLATKRDE